MRKEGSVKTTVTGLGVSKKAPIESIAIAEGGGLRGSDERIYCFALDLTETKVNLFTEQAKTVQKVLISGQVMDLYPTVVQGIQPEALANAGVMPIVVPIKRYRNR